MIRIWYLAASWDKLPPKIWPGHPRQTDQTGHTLDLGLIMTHPKE